ncbi:MAG: hypothetical protein EA424_22060 [Planctomycetaceae bacterium]|nr:MAG: hypothetical protein EA424_22060 [Planctomycetaceae bacterium]
MSATGGEAVLSNHPADRRGPLAPWRACIDELFWQQVYQHRPPQSPRRRLRHLVSLLLAGAIR